MGLFKKSKQEPDLATLAPAAIIDRKSLNMTSQTTIPSQQQAEPADAAPLTEAEHLQIMAAANEALDKAEENAPTPPASPPPPSMPPRPQISLETDLSNLKLSSTARGPNSAATAGSEDYFSLSEISPLPSVSQDGGEMPTTPSTMEKIRNGVVTGMNATTHFAGGLLSHPSESTKHFSILRHSNGLVFYQGTATSLPISIFSDAPMPADYTLFLQAKGWSGSAGMAAKALVGRNGYWLDVTPTIAATASQLDPVDEKAYQRDIAYFLKKADKNVRKTHLLRYTCLIRIPVEAGDGYFRLVLCTGPKRKVLCPSPVFRVLSTSISPSSMKGASLSTLPLEMGAMVLTTAAKVTALKAVAPVKLAAMAPINPYMPGQMAKRTGKAVYSVSGAGKRVDATVGDANARYDQLHGTLFTELDGAEATPDSGPVAPYPLEFGVSVEAGNSSGVDGLSIPSMKFNVTDDDTAHRLHGFYFGWARVAPPKAKKGKKPDPSEIPTSWFQCVISARHTKPSELARLHVSHNNHKTITITLVEETEGPSFAGSTVDVKIMGFIRPAVSSLSVGVSEDHDASEPRERAENEAETMNAVADMAIAQASLDRPAWGPELVLERVETAKSEKSMKGGVEYAKSRYAHTRMTVSRQVDRVPFYRAGLRVGADRLREKGVGTGGIYVVRD